MLIDRQNSRVDSVIVMFQVGKPLVVFSGMNRKPESNPPASGSQGLLAAIWVTLWLPGDPAHVKTTVEPTGAVMLDGMNWKIPPEVLASAPT